MFRESKPFWDGLRIPSLLGELLFEHLKKIGIDVDVIRPRGSPDDLWQISADYSFSIKVKGLNFNVLQLNGFIADEMDSAYYQIDYIIRDSEMNVWDVMPTLKWKQKRKLEKTLGRSRVSVEDWNRCVRLHGRKHEGTIFGQFPTKETLEHYDMRALAVRRLLENEPSLWDQPLWTFVEEPARCGICNAVQPFPVSSLTEKAYFPEFRITSGALLLKDAPPYPPHNMYVCETCRKRRHA
jgi:hypothetical protein